MEANENIVTNILEGNIFIFDDSILSPSAEYNGFVLNGSSELNVVMIVSSILIITWLLVLSGRFLFYGGRFEQIFSVLDEWWGNGELSELVLVSEDTARGFKVIEKFSRIILLTLATAIVLGVGCVLLKAVPAISKTSAVYTHQYSWMLSAAYIHDVAPLVVLVAPVVVLTSIYAHFAQQNTARTSNAPRFSSFRQKVEHFAVLNGQIFVFLSINIVVILVVNFAYVYAVIENSPSLILIQIAMALFKSIWNVLYSRLTMFISSELKQRGTFSLALHDDLMRLHNYYFTLLVINMIVAPCVATALSDTACFYELFEQQPASIIVTQVPCSGDYLEGYENGALIYGCGSSHGSKSVPENLANAYYPPFIYNCQCGSAWIVNYVPILMYFFFISGFVRPLFDAIALMKDGWVRRSLPPWMISLLFSRAFLFQGKNVKSFQHKKHQNLRLLAPRSCR